MRSAFQVAIHCAETGHHESRIVGPRLAQRRRSIPISSATYTTTPRFVERGRLLALTWRDGGIFHTRLGVRATLAEPCALSGCGPAPRCGSQAPLRASGCSGRTRTRRGKSRSRGGAGPLRRGSLERPASQRSFSWHIPSVPARCQPRRARRGSPRLGHALDQRLRPV